MAGAFGVLLGVLLFVLLFWLSRRIVDFSFRLCYRLYLRYRKNAP